MTKKILMLVVFVLMLLWINIVQANTLNKQLDIQTDKLLPILEIKKGDIWEELNLEKYTLDKAIIYKIEDEKVNIKQDERILRIIRNGYMFKSPNDIGVEDLEDAYMVTKLSIDCIINNYKDYDIDNIYRVNINADDVQKVKGRDIINAIKVLVDIGYNGQESFERNIDILELDNFDVDDVEKDNYYSQSFQIVTTSKDFLGYRVKEKKEANVNYNVVNAETIENQEEFKMFENVKILVPIEESQKDFNIEVDFEANCLFDKIEKKQIASENYLIYTQEEGKKEFTLTVKNENLPTIPDETEKDEDKGDNETKEPENNEKIDINKLKDEIKNELKYELIGVIKKELNEEIKKEIEKQLREKEKTEEKDDIYEKEMLNKSNKEKNDNDIEKMQILPRTGNDYFLIKLIFVDLVLFIIFLIMSLIKKQTTNLKQSAYLNSKE